MIGITMGDAAGVGVEFTLKAAAATSAHDRAATLIFGCVKTLQTNQATIDHTHLRRIGTEDETQIVPAVAAARAEGVDVMGPVPADAVFHRAQQGRFAPVVAQYHDQRHIPIKLVAFDIAGRGIGNHDNRNAAIAYANRPVAGREP